VVNQILLLATVVTFSSGSSYYTVRGASITQTPHHVVSLKGAPPCSNTDIMLASQCLLACL